MISFERYNFGDSVTSKYVQGVWALNNIGASETIHLLPDGYPEIVIPISGEIIFNIGNQTHHINKPSVIGQINQAGCITVSENAHMLFIKLYPFVTGILVDKSAKEIRNAVCALDLLSSQLEDIILSFKRRIRSDFNQIDEMNSLLTKVKRLFDNYHIPPILIRDQASKYEEVKYCHIGFQSLKTRMSKRYLEKLYEQYVGLSPKQFLKVLRVKKASILLSNPDLQRISTVSKTLGYHDNSHLYKDFKSLCQLSPRQYISNQHPMVADLSYLNQWDYS